MNNENLPCRTLFGITKQFLSNSNNRMEIKSGNMVFGTVTPGLLICMGKVKYKKCSECEKDYLCPIDIDDSICFHCENNTKDNITSSICNEHNIGDIVCINYNDIHEKRKLGGPLLVINKTKRHYVMMELKSINLDTYRKTQTLISRKHFKVFKYHRHINISECNTKDGDKCSICERILNELNEFTDDDNKPLCIYCNDEFN